MANMKSPKEKLALYALKEAADDESSDGQQMDDDAPMDECVCPKCGYRAPETKFKKPMPQHNEMRPGELDDEG